MSALPLELLAGKKSAKKERLAVRSNKEAMESRRQAIRDKVERERDTELLLTLLSVVDFFIFIFWEGGSLLIHSFKDPATPPPPPFHSTPFQM